MLVESPGGEDSLSNTDDLLGTDGDVDDDKGEVTKMESSEKNRSPSNGRHEVNEVDDDGMEEENHDPEDAEEEEEDGEGENEEEIEMDREKRRMDETLRHGGTLAEESEVGDTAALHDEYKTTQQEGQAAVVQKQKKHKVYQTLFDCCSDYLHICCRSMDLNCSMCL